MYFRILIILLSINFIQLNASNDLLRDRIIRYNKIKTPLITIDSQTCFYNLQLIDKTKDIKVSTQIIDTASKNNSTPYFFIILSICFILSLLRRLSQHSYSDFISNFFSLRIIHNRPEYNFVAVLFIALLFLLSVSYLVYFFLSFDGKPFFISKNIFNKTLLIISSIVFFKWIINKIIILIFDLKKNISEYNYYIVEFMYIFLSISLPLFFFATMLDAPLQKPIFISISVLLLLSYFVMWYKLIYTNSRLLTRNVFITLIYFYTLEIIPILLLSKYFKTFAV